MKEYTFTLNYRLSDKDRDPDLLIERLGEAGCTDAVVGIGVAGRLAAEFTREAPAARDAIRSALEDVKRAIPDAELVEASPDFVGLTDVAELMGVSRQSVRKLMLAHADFPLPVHEGTASVWHLADVLAWLDGRKGYRPDAILRETSTAALEVNVAKDLRRYGKLATDSLKRLVA